MCARGFFLIFVAACAAGAACSDGSTPAGIAISPSAYDAATADAAWVAALAGSDPSTAGSALDADFEWTNSRGRTHTRAETVRNLHMLAADLRGESNLQHYDYGHVHVVTGGREGARMMRVWATRPEGWRVLAVITTMLVTGTTPFAASGAATGDCDNPCRTMPFIPASENAKEIADVFKRLKMDEWHPDPADWATYVLDDVYYVTETAQLSKDDRVKRLAALKESGAPSTATPSFQCASTISATRRSWSRAIRRIAGATRITAFAYGPSAMGAGSSRTLSRPSSGQRRTSPRRSALNTGSRPDSWDSSQMQRVPAGTFQFLVIVAALLAAATSAEAQCPAPPPLSAPENRAYAESRAIQQAVTENGGRRSVIATRLADGELIEIDGRLDEAVWSRALPAGDFIQIDPNNGQPATERTDVRIAFSSDALYLGVTAYDSEPDTIIGKQRRRDEPLCSDDKIRWTIDTFLDARTGYFFEMNPEGAMADALMGNTGQNRAWDGVWTGRARRSEIGWTLEVELPFRTFNFNPNSDTWGFNIERTLHRNNEVSIWMGWVRNQGLQRMANAGLITGIRDVTQGRGLDIKPYGLFSATGSPGRGRSGFDRDANAGIDLFYNPSPTLRTNLTVNTDFAQVEVDQRQVNLTRFSLFFPERRDFFLDGATFLDFVSDTGGQSGGDQIIPFFSRRIGLSAGGTPQTIDFGTKMTGQAGAHDIGLLHVRTGADDDAAMIGEDFTVARLKRRMLRQSYIGGLFTRRDARGDGLDQRNTIGVDFRLATSAFLGSQNLALAGWGLHASRARPDASGRTSAYGLTVEYPNDLWNASMGAREIQPGFDPAVGFVNRTAYRKYTPGVNFAPRPRNHRYIRRFEFGASSDTLTDLDNELLERSITFQLFEMQFHASDNFGVELTPTYERLDAPFAISRSITLPAGSEYDYTRLLLRAQTANNRTLSVNARFETGGFYSGTRHQTVVGLNVRARPGYFLYLNGEWNQIDLAEGSFATNVFRVIGEAQFSPFVTVVNNIQYDTQSALLGWQSRFRWIVSPGNDLYVVYNHNWLDDPLIDRFSTLDKRLASKILYTYRF